MTAELREAPGSDALTPSPDATRCHDLLLGRCDPAPNDPRGIRILAKSIYRELRQAGQQDEAIMQLAGELLSLLASDVKDRRRGLEATAGSAPTPHRAR